MSDPLAEKADHIVERFVAKRRRRFEKGAEYREMMRWTGRAIEVPLGVIVGMGLGVLLERNWGVPYASWAGLFFGLCAAVRSGYRLAKAYLAAFPDDDDRGGDAR